MRRWIGKILGYGIVAYLAYWAYEQYRAGIFDLPPLPDGAYTLSFESGFRAIVVDADVPAGALYDGPRYLRSLSIANRDRRYLGVPFEVEVWFEDAWSWCKKPNENDLARLKASPDELRKSVENARFEAVCQIDVDGKQVERGLIFSVPRL